MKILLSSCLAGKDVMYWGGNFFFKDFFEKVTDNPNVEIVHFCPENIMLGTPRNNMLIHGGSGDDLWDGKAKLLDTDGKDLTEVMKEGALKMLEFANQEKPDLVILVEGSDSCGVNFILDPENVADGRNQFKKGSGVAASLLRKNGFNLCSHQETDRIEEYLNSYGI